MWSVTRKGTSWVSYSEIHFFRVLNREFYDESKNINMLVGSWSFWVSKCPKKMGTALKCHKLSIDVIVTLHVHHKINTRYKILQKDVTMYLLWSIFFYLLLFIIPLILPPLFLLQMSHQIFFLVFSYTIVSALSQLKKKKKKKKKKKQLHTDIFYVLLKNYFPRC